jgi:polyisoprenoid-binding protein YceI
MKNTLLVPALALLLSPAIAFSQTTWKSTTGTVSFTIKNAGVTVTGRFSGLSTGLVFSPDKLASSSLKGSVGVGTIKTGIDKRDEDLKGDKYFDEGKYKLIDVKSAKLYKKGNQYAGLFNITIKGVTKQVEIPFQFTQTGDNAEFKGDFTINRRDFGVGGKTLTMSDDAHVTIEVKAKKG